MEQEPWTVRGSARGRRVILIGGGYMIMVLSDDRWRYYATLWLAESPGPSECKCIIEGTTCAVTEDRSGPTFQKSAA